MLNQFAKKAQWMRIVIALIWTIFLFVLAWTVGGQILAWLKTGAVPARDMLWQIASWTCVGDAETCRLQAHVSSGWVGLDSILNWALDLHLVIFAAAICGGAWITLNARIHDLEEQSAILGREARKEYFKARNKS